MVGRLAGRPASIGTADRTGRRLLFSCGTAPFRRSEDGEPGLGTPSDGRDKQERASEGGVSRGSTSRPGGMRHLPMLRYEVLEKDYCAWTTINWLPSLSRRKKSSGTPPSPPMNCSSTSA